MIFDCHPSPRAEKIAHLLTTALCAGYTVRGCGPCRIDGTAMILAHVECMPDDWHTQQQQIVAELHARAIWRFLIALEYFYREDIPVPIPQWAITIGVADLVTLEKQGVF